MAYVYIMTNRVYGTLYVGVTNNLIRRVWEHKQLTHPGFTKRYKLTKLVYFEASESIIVAIHREKELKNSRREEKIALIIKVNPTWRDLWDDIAVG